MNKILFLIVALVFPILFFGQGNFDSLLQELDKTVNKYQLYLNQKETKIDGLKKLLKNKNSDFQQYELYGKLYNEYKSYQSDSALVYVRKGLLTAKNLKDPEKLNEAKLNFASIMGTLSGGGKEVISIGERCLLGANAGLGISLGNDCVVESGTYITAGSKITLPDGNVVKASELSGANNLLFRRNSLTGGLEAVMRTGTWGGLNSLLHAN